MYNPSCNFLIAVVDFTKTCIPSFARVILLGMVGICASLPSNAQFVSMELDTNVIALGDQTILTVAATHDPMHGSGFFSWPTWGDTIDGGLEIIKSQGLDTMAVDLPNGSSGIRMTQKLTVTHWDSGFHAIAPIRMLWNKDTLESNPIGIQVLMPEAGKSGEIAGHAPIRMTSWSWQERLRQWLPWLLATLLIGALAIWSFRKYKQRTPRNKEDRIAVDTPREAAHVIALRTLEAIQKDAVWKKGQIKTHHASASTALRLYLEHRFNFPALERSTTEIIQAINRLPLRENDTENLIEVLTLADLVKFAKFTPEVSDHQRIISRSIEFVENTMPSQEANETLVP